MMCGRHWMHRIWVTVMFIPHHLPAQHCQVPSDRWPGVPKHCCKARRRRHFHGIINYNYARRISFVSTMLNQKNNQIWQKEFCKLICMVQSKLRYSHFEGKLAYHRSCLRFVLVVWSVKPGASYGYAFATSHGQCGLRRGEAGSAHT